MSAKLLFKRFLPIIIGVVFILTMVMFSMSALHNRNTEDANSLPNASLTPRVLTSTPSATPTQIQTPTFTPTPVKYLQAPQYLKIYADTSFLSDILAEIPSGGKVEWVGEQKDFSWDPSWYWYRVRFTPESEVSENEPYVGFGFWSDIYDQYIYIIGVIPGSPAEKAGLRNGDEIVGIDGVDFDQITTDAAYQLLKGPAGTSATLKIKRWGYDMPLTIKVNREVIETTHMEGYVALPTKAGETLLGAECPRFVFVSQLLMLEPYGVFGNNQGLLFEQDQSGDSLTAYAISTGEVRTFKFNDIEIDAVRLVIPYEDASTGDYKLYPYWQALGYQTPTRYIFQADRIYEAREDCEGFRCELDHVTNMPDESWTREDVTYFYKYSPFLVRVSYPNLSGEGFNASSKIFNLEHSLEVLRSNNSSFDLEQIELQISYEQATGNLLNNSFVNYGPLPDDWINTVLTPSRLFTTYDLLSAVSNPELEVGQIYRFFECVAFVP